FFQNNLKQNGFAIFKVAIAIRLREIGSSGDRRECRQGRELPKESLLCELVFVLVVERAATCCSLQLPVMPLPLSSL
ncbi:hypothetical protein N9X45_06225, partial [Pseudomonadales bacterium]|nr:hypothetical protein [Pseudomonadales bacterium]